MPKYGGEPSPTLLSQCKFSEIQRMVTPRKLLITRPSGKSAGFTGGVVKMSVRVKIPEIATNVTSVLIVDDHRSFSDLLGIALGREPDLVVCATADTAVAAVDLATQLRPDVVIVDIELHGQDGSNGLTVTKHIRQLLPSAVIVVITAHREPRWVDRALAAGASAFGQKSGSLDDLLSMIRSARTASDLSPGMVLCEQSRLGPNDPSQPRLTGRERDVLERMAAGCSAKQIARELDISVHTCRGYVKSIHAKLGVSSQLEAVVRARALGLLEDNA